MKNIRLKVLAIWRIIRANEFVVATDKKDFGNELGSKTFVGIGDETTFGFIERIVHFFKAQIALAEAMDKDESSESDDTDWVLYKEDVEAAKDTKE